jgi:hypothetical protein
MALTRRVPLTAFLLGILVAPGVAPTQVIPPGSGGVRVAPSTAALTLRERRLLTSWLQCIECGTSYIDSVRALGLRKPQATIDSLRNDLLRGPTTVARANMASQFSTAYDAIVAEAGPGVINITKPQYVDHYLAAFGAQYRRRAAFGLARVGGTAARQALDRGLDSALSGSPNFGSRVKAALRFARDSLWTP